MSKRNKNPRHKKPRRRYPPLERSGKGGEMTTRPGLSLWEIIGVQRRRLGMTVGELAEQAGLSRNYVGQIERGKASNPKLSALIAIFDALEMDIDIQLKERSKE